MCKEYYVISVRTNMTLVLGRVDCYADSKWPGNHAMAIRAQNSACKILTAHSDKDIIRLTHKTAILPGESNVQTRRPQFQNTVSQASWYASSTPRVGNGRVVRSGRFFRFVRRRAGQVRNVAQGQRRRMAGKSCCQRGRCQHISRARNHAPKRRIPNSP